MKIITTDEMSVRIKALCPYATIWMDDVVYTVPDTDWYLNSMGPFFKDMMYPDGAMRPKNDWNTSNPNKPQGWTNYFDCNKFSVCYLAECLKAFDKIKPIDTRDTGIAVGVFRYKPDWANGAGHAINIMFCEDKPGNEPRLMFIDPQAATTEVILSTAEAKTAGRVNF